MRTGLCGFLVTAILLVACGKKDEEAKLPSPVSSQFPSLVLLKTVGPMRYTRDENYPEYERILDRKTFQTKEALTQDFWVEKFTVPKKQRSFSAKPDEPEYYDGFKLKIIENKEMQFDRWEAVMSTQFNRWADRVIIRDVYCNAWMRDLPERADGSRGYDFMVAPLVVTSDIYSKGRQQWYTSVVWGCYGPAEWLPKIIQDPHDERIDKFY